MKKGKRTRERYKMIGWQGIILFLAILFMTIAYAQITGQQMTVEADVTAEAQEGVFIADVVSQDTTNGKINYYQDTLLSSKVTLPSSTSTVTYEVTLYNNSNQDYVYIGELIDENAYKGANGEKNESIGYTINGLTKGVTTIAPKASLTFTITFAFKDGADTTDNVLESIINFRFKELPIIDLSNEGETYTLENAYPGFETTGYTFTVANYTQTNTNFVPMTYGFETTIDSPMQAKIYDENGTEVTGEIDLKGDGQAEEHTYTLKIIWDAEDTEYEEKIHQCNIKLIAKPTDEKYEDYEIVKEFNVEITICKHTYENGICTKCGAECEHTYENAICTKCGCRITVKAGEKAKANSEYSDGTNTAIIPAGFTVSGVESEQTIDEGLVVYLIDDKTDAQIKAIDWTNATTVASLQKTYDQFVWIPVEDINDMYMCQSEDGTKSCNIKVANGEAYCTTHSSNAMAGRLYIAGGYNASLTTQTYTSGSGYREPDTLDYYAEYSFFNDYVGPILGKSYSSNSELKTDLQSEYNEIVESVYQNEGFYIGRYETSYIEETDGIAIEVIAGLNLKNESGQWYFMYAQQKDYAENKGLISAVGSTMIQGAAYDQVMKFVNGALDGTGETFDVTVALSTRHAGFITGERLADKVKNIYDLEGCVNTWTTTAVFEAGAGSEGTDIDNRITRGGYSGTYGDFSAASAGSALPRGTGNYTGSICQLYLNCSHTFEDGTCTKCGYECKHDFEDNICTNCGYECIEHKYTDGVCTVCGKVCAHKYIDNVCTICGKERKVIPISTVDQLLKIGSNEQVTIDGKTYTFSSDANYELQNDISFSIADYIDQYPDAFEGGLTENLVTNYETANSSDNPYYTYTAPVTGEYKLETWGAQGGARNSTYTDGGKGAYAAGTVTLNEGQQIYVYVGSQGLVGYSTYDGEGGYNGGGTGVRRFAGGGGGATHMATSTGLLSSLSSNKEAVLIVAGAGGGAGYYNTSHYGHGGYAGGSGTAGAGYCYHYNSSSSSYAVGQGATQSSGGSAGTNDYSGTSGSFGQGGSAATSYYDSFSSAGGGGGGYYGGGGAGASVSGSFYAYTAGGGGGSSYVANSLTDTSLIAGNALMTSPTGTSVTGHSGDGYARITLLTEPVIEWIDIETKIQNGTLTGEFLYNGNTITVTDTEGETSYYPTIPISTVDQLLKIGSNEEVTIDGKTYIFSNDANYELQNNLTFTVSDYIDQYPNAFETQTITIENQITNYETANSSENPYSTYTAPATGTYKLEVWGAQGGSYSSTYYGGKGGYSVGTITLNEGDNLYVYVGGQPTGYNSSSTSGNTNAGGYNGGGAGRTYYYSSTYTYALGGGGATDIRIGGTTYYDRVIVAGGGSGSTNGSTGYAGGGAQSAGYSSSYYATYTTAGTGGSFGVGGSSGGSYNYKYGAAGGGGGWYGGGAGTGQSDSSTAYRKYCGGGSGYIWTSGTASNVPSGYTVGTQYYLTDAATYAGNTSFASTSGGTETGHSGNGYARITLVLGTGNTTAWIDIETQKTNGTLTGQFLYNGNTITVTNTNGETEIFDNSNGNATVQEYAEKNSKDNPYYTYTAPATGTYKLEVWGAQGGTYDSNYAEGGKGGYSVGTITLNKGDNLYVYVGGSGSFGTSSSSYSGGGYNGGGDADYKGGAGGGATDIRFTSGTWNNSTSLLSRVIVAGGGGGAHSYDSHYNSFGGYGGGTTGGNGSTGFPPYLNYYGFGASQTEGGKGGEPSEYGVAGNAGTLGTGGRPGKAYLPEEYNSSGAGRRRLVWRRRGRYVW